MPHTFHRRPALLVIVMCALIAGAVALPSGTAMAHNTLLSSDPADGATLSVAPAQITWVFDRTVPLVTMTVTLTDATGARSELLGSIHGAAGDTQVVTPLPPLQPGPVSVRWRLVGPDGHPVTGRVEFAISSAAPTTMATDTATATADVTPTTVAVDGAAGLLRTKLQHHYQRIGLLFAGSEPSTMRMLFTDTDQPFYAQADLVDVDALSLVSLTDIIDHGFEGAPPPGLAARIHAFAGGHPQRSMQLADAAWQAARDDVTPADAWATALERCRVATASGHETRFSDLQPSDQAAMRLTATNGVLFGRDAALLELSRSSAQLARRRLIERGQVIERDGQVTVVDPLYADWIRHRFPI